MKTTNSTIEYYNTNTDSFVSDTINVDMSEVYSKFLAYLKPGMSIFDIGCGSGRDSKFFIENGFNITAIDGSRQICDYATDYIGQKVLCMNFDQISFEAEFDAAWACSSLLHVEKKSMNDILCRISNSLKPNGILYCSFKYGNSERIDNGRFFSDYTEDSVSQLFNLNTNLICKECWVSLDTRPERENEKWLNIIAQKMV